MDAFGVYAQLLDARRVLDAAEDHAIAAHVEWAMTLLDRKYGVASDRSDAAPMPTVTLTIPSDAQI